MKAPDTNYYLLETTVTGASPPEKILEWIDFLHTFPQNPEVVDEIAYTKALLHLPYRNRFYVV